MTTDSEVTRFVATKDIVIPFKTLEKAAEEADGYKFQAVGDGIVACKHGDNAYILIEKMSPDNIPVIGGSCKAWTFAHDQDGCKHVATLLKRSSKPTAELDKEMARDLMAAGWTGGKGNLQPPSDEKLPEAATLGYAQEQAGYVKPPNTTPTETTSDPDGEDNEGGDPVPPEKPELGDKVWNRSCPHCDKVFEGTDLEAVKREHQDHIKTCQAKPEPAPEVSPKQEQEQAVITATCEWCGEEMQHVGAIELQKLAEAHRETCPKRPDANHSEIPNSSKQEHEPDGAENALTETPQPEEEPKMEEEEHEGIPQGPTKTYTHLDGSEFETAEALLDYAEKIKAKQTAVATRTVRHKPMIKGISPQLQEVGRIAVGEKGGLTQSGKSRLPTKLDHFIFTTLNKDEDDRYIRDPSMMAMFGDHCTEIPVRLLYNDIELNFPTFYAKYSRSGIKLRGDGENWTVYNDDGTRDEVFDPNNERGFLDDPDVKPHGILTVLVEGQNSVGGVFKFRTTSWNSINNILSSLSVIKNMCGMLTYIPLKLMYRKKEVTPKGMAHKTWIPVVSVEFRGSIEELQAQASEVRQYTTAGQREETKQIEAAVREHLIEDESVETQQDIAAEFSPGVV